ncbi:MAG: phosphodiesterase [Acholeplasmatales bacterium]|nr:phosphodiesterase [Acholeplasmatales bacterium]
MKYLIVSDIHGSSDSTKRILEIFEKEKCDIMINGGDVLYHGPRNDLPANYCPKECIALLNPYADKIICVNGNCDAEVDQMVLRFEIKHHYDAIMNGLNVHVEHGHHLDEYQGHPDLVISGHTHIPVLEKKDNGIIYLNPGSITIPKGGSKRGYAIWDENIITLMTLDGEIVKILTY